MSIADKIPTVNYHLWRPCNMKCGFCFATFQDIDPHILPKGHLRREESLSVVELLAEAGFTKINFAGGEPVLCPWLPNLVSRAWELGLTTSMVTNASPVTAQWLDSVNGRLDWVALSIDSVNPHTLLRMGRTTRSGPMSEGDYYCRIDMLRERSIRVKVNTVVTRFNLMENLTDFIIKAQPERWKLFQVLTVDGQNDLTVGDHTISDNEFERHVRLSRRVEAHGVVVVPENNELMRGSYVMVDPAGRFFDNVEGCHRYSQSILEAGVDRALSQVSVDSQKFLSRNGLYDW